MLYYGLRVKRRGDKVLDSATTVARKKKTVKDLMRLREGLQQHFAEHSNADETGNESVRIATWNLRDFGKEKRGRRLDEAVYYIAEVISHFDIVALQEVYSDTRAFARLVKLLGGNWNFIMSDASSSGRGNAERMVFLFNSNKVFSKGVAGEIDLEKGQRLLLPDTVAVKPGEELKLELPTGTTLTPPDPKDVRIKGGKLRFPVLVDLPEGTKFQLPTGSQLLFSGKPTEMNSDKEFTLGNGLNRTFSTDAGIRIQPEKLAIEETGFARPPYIVSLQSRWLKLSICTVHIYYGDNAEGSEKLERRRSEIEALTKMLSKKAKDQNNSDADSYMIALGDFNIISPEHHTMEALKKNKFVIPDKIQAIPAGTNVKRDKYYDQIAVWQGKSSRRKHSEKYTSAEVVGAGVFDFFDHVFRMGDDDPGGEDEKWFKKRDAENRPGKSFKYSDWRTYHMSDHLPMWVEMQAGFEDEYLESLLKDNEA